VTADESPLVTALRQQEQAWRERSLLRRLYREWFALIASRISSVHGASVELGAGIAQLKRSLPDVVATDIEPTPWSDDVVNAEELPYEPGSIANLILFDVFHHLARPARFLDEADRVLKPGGRVLIVDPYCSPVSLVAYKNFHHERTNIGAAPFEYEEDIAEAPLEGNQARATLAFFRNRREYDERWPRLKIVERRRFAFVLYPLSGGFTRRPLVPAALYPPLSVLERALTPLAPLLAFRCLVVLERLEETGALAARGAS
jgi:SAM-dependent methyltransferase